MGDLTDSDSTLVSVLREHVLNPLTDAQAVVQREATEINTEREAFDQLAQRVTTVETVPDLRPEPQAHTLRVESQLQAADQLREAYRETVMNVPHYEDVCGESLETNVAAELPPEVAVLFQEPADQITPDQKKSYPSRCHECTGQPRDARCQSGRRTGVTCNCLRRTRCGHHATQ